MTSRGREAVAKPMTMKGFLPYLSLQLPIMGDCNIPVTQLIKRCQV